MTVGTTDAGHQALTLLGTWTRFARTRCKVVQQVELHVVDQADRDQRHKYPCRRRHAGMCWQREGSSEVGEVGHRPLVTFCSGILTRACCCLGSEYERLGANSSGDTI